PPRDRIDDRGFSCPVGADQTADFAACHGERDAVDGLDAAVIDGHVIDLEDDLGPFCRIARHAALRSSADPSDLRTGRMARHARSSAPLIPSGANTITMISAAPKMASQCVASSPMRSRARKNTTAPTAGPQRLRK